jgi:membrane-bound metal-dependent hydrolase YbcI (DUF457 family)
MPQNGFHGLVGLATARALSGRIPKPVHSAFTTAVVFGAVFPDIDMYPTGVAFLLTGPESVYVWHRTATHCIFFVLLLALIGTLARGRPLIRWAFWGLALGVLTHEVLDIFFWFAPIDIMWPFSRWPSDHPVFQMLNIWRQDFSGLLSNLRDACEFAAFALFLMGLRRIVHGQRGPGKDLDRVRVWEFVLWTFFTIAIVTAFVFQAKPGRQQILVNVPYLLVFLPYCWSRAWAYREQIAAWSRIPPKSEVA